jgi:hypothetical protein
MKFFSYQKTISSIKKSRSLGLGQRRLQQRLYVNCCGLLTPYPTSNSSAIKTPETHKRAMMAQNQQITEISKFYSPSIATITKNYLLGLWSV